MKSHSDDIGYFEKSLSLAAKGYSEATGLDHPRASEVAHIGRGLEKISTLMKWYLLHDRDILALL